MRLEVNREALLTILQSNRSKHAEIYAEAVEGYQRVALTELESKIESLKSGRRKPVQIWFNLQLPQNQLEDYDRVIGLLTMSNDVTVPLSDAEYGMYVLDQWQWKQAFLISNKMYSSTAAMMAERDPEED
jgi:hypothetical protein